MIVFGDTSAFFALMVRDDQLHTRAKENFAHFAKHGFRLVTSSYVLLETLALLQRRIGLDAVQDFQARIFPLLDMVWVDAEWYGRAMQRVIVESRKNLSLTDCLSFEIMEAQEIREAFSLDKHFEEKGFTLTAYSSLDDQPEEGDG